MPLSVDPHRLKLGDAAGTAGVLLGFHCQECGVFMFGPASFCQSCASPQLEAAELGNHAALYSFTIVRVPPAGWPGPVPYILAEAELPQGPHVLAELIDCPLDAPRIGMALELAVRLVQSSGDAAPKAVYKWRPA